MMLQRLEYFLRLSTTGFSFLVFGIGGAVIPWVSLPIIHLWPGSQQQKQVRARKLVHYTFRFFIVMMRSLGVLTWEIKGQEQLEKQGVVVLANHPTLLDVVFMVALLPHADCVVKSSLRSNPAMRGFLYLTGFIPNDSGDLLLQQAKRSLGGGSALIIFPEGTRSTPGRALDFQRGAANVAVRSQAPVTTVLIDCWPPTLSKQHRWYHIPHKRMHFTFKVTQAISITDYQHEPASKAARRLTRDLEAYFTKELPRHD